MASLATDVADMTSVYATRAVLTAVLVVTFVSMVVRKTSRFPSYLPGPSWYDYLPGGIAHALYSDARQFNRTLRLLAERYGDAFQVIVGFRRVVATSHPDDIVQVLSRRSDFCRAPRGKQVLQLVLPGGLFSMAAGEHYHARKCIRERFNISHMDKYHNVMVAAVRELCQMLSTTTCEKPSEEGQQNDENEKENQNVLNMANRQTDDKPIGKMIKNQADGTKNSLAQQDHCDRIVDIQQALSIAAFRVITSIVFGETFPLDERAELSDDVQRIFDEMLRDAITYPLGAILEPFGARRTLLERKAKVHQRCLRAIRQRMARAKRDVNDNNNNNDDRNEAEAEDLLDVLIKLGGGETSVTTAHVVTFVAAGAHTTNQALTWAIYEICKHPALIARLEAEVDALYQHRANDIGCHNNDADTFLRSDDVRALPLVTAVWKETLRLHPSAGVLVRVATRDVTLRASNITLPKDTPVSLQIWRAHTHERYWADPLMFNPDRWISSSLPSHSGTSKHTPPPGCYAPFSMGSRGCLGQFFAEYQGVLVLAELFRRFRFSLACNPTEIVSCSGWVESPKFSSKHDATLDMGLPVHVTLRNH